jgi:hypothetical protein
MYKEVSAGYNSFGVNFKINILSDVDHTTVLATILNGEIVYDITKY